MIEAVGHEYWSTYFRTIDRLLAPGGKVGIQAITMPHDRMLATRRTLDVDQQVHLPRRLPAVGAGDRRGHPRGHHAARHRPAVVRQHYAETLRRWDDAFGAASDQVRELGFDETFQRMWHFYLEYSRAGFASGYLDVQQIILER